MVILQWATICLILLIWYIEASLQGYYKFFCYTLASQARIQVKTMCSWKLFKPNKNVLSVKEINHSMKVIWELRQLREQKLCSPTSGSLQTTNIASQWPTELPSQFFSVWGERVWVCAWICKSQSYMRCRPTALDF